MGRLLFKISMTRLVGTWSCPCEFSSAHIEFFQLFGARCSPGWIALIATVFLLRVVNDLEI
jgi:hypothetical protein